MNWLYDNDRTVQVTWQQRIAQENNAWMQHQRHKYKDANMYEFMRTAAADIAEDMTSTNLDSNSNYFTAIVVSERPKKKSKKSAASSTNQYLLGQSRTAQGSHRYLQQEEEHQSKSANTASNIDRFSQ